MKSNKFCFHRAIWYDNCKYIFNLCCQIHDTLQNNEAQVICAMVQYQTCSIHNLLAIYQQVCLKINENLVLFSADLQRSHLIISEKWEILLISPSLLSWFPASLCSVHTIHHLCIWFVWDPNISVFISHQNISS